MAQRRRELRPSVEAFESRSLLSGGMTVSSMVGEMSAPGPARSIRLHGTLQGQFQIAPSIPDVGKTYSLTGSGHVHGIRHASVTGDLQSVGFIARGSAQGDLVLRGASGTVTLHLTGPEQGGFQPLPDVFSFTTTGGTGRYRTLHESGTATLTMSPGQLGITGQPGGQFTLVLTTPSARR